MNVNYDLLNRQRIAEAVALSEDDQATIIGRVRCTDPDCLADNQSAAVPVPDWQFAPMTGMECGECGNMTATFVEGKVSRVPSRNQCK